MTAALAATETETIKRSHGPEAAELARRLRAETQGEVLFDAASRGRYATDASIYQIMPTGVFVPRTTDDVVVAMAISRDLRTPLGGVKQSGVGREGGVEALKFFTESKNVCVRV